MTDMPPLGTPAADSARFYAEMSRFVGTGTLVRGALFPVSSLAMILFRTWLLAFAVWLFRGAAVRGE
jgi:hypothetical protein